MIRGGTVVTVLRQERLDIRIRAGKIVLLAPSLVPSPDERVIDAMGLHVLPGGIDPHTHLTQPVNTPPQFRYADDLLSGSSAAIAGGITSLGTMTWNDQGESLRAALVRDAQAVTHQALADVILHPVFYTPSSVEEIPLIGAAGFMTLKLFINHALPEALQVRALERAREAGLLTLLHCEDAHLLKQAEEKLTRAGTTSLAYFHRSRPVAAEVAGIRQAIGLGRKTRAPIYIVHVSSAAGLAECEQALRSGLQLTVETRPVYLHLTEDKYAGVRPGLFTVQPPLRKMADVEALWRGMAGGTIDVVASDHIGWTLDQKLDPSSDLHSYRPAVPDLETMLPFLYSEGVAKNRLSLSQFVALTTTNAAKRLGLFPRKGHIEVGCDADLVVWDFERKRVVRANELHSRAGWSVFEGIELCGWPKTTIRRGEVVFDDGRVLARPGSGRLLAGGTSCD